MPNNLDAIVREIKACWKGLDSDTTTEVRRLLTELAKTSTGEEWVQSIMLEKPSSKELYRDPEHGFILLAHTEKNGTYRPPHNHGAGWVFYAVQSGEMEMTTYRNVTTAEGITHLVSRGTDRLQVGDCRVFLPGDIHDTLCKSENFVQYRLTSSDFSDEIKSKRMVRFLNERSAAL
jgi:predicted metal-dependent enzyme (double-stranded beta helix superfamily)